MNLLSQFACPLNMSGDDHLLPVIDKVGGSKRKVNEWHINIYIVVQSGTTNAGLNLVWSPSLEQLIMVMCLHAKAKVRIAFLVTHSNGITDIVNGNRPTFSSRFIKSVDTLNQSVGKLIG